MDQQRRHKLNNLYNYFVRNTILKSCISGKSSTPISLGYISHHMQPSVSFFCFVMSSTKVEIVLLSLSIMPCVNVKHDITNVRTVWAKYFIWTFSLPFDKSYDDHVLVRLLSRFCRKRKLSSLIQIFVWAILSPIPWLFQRKL